MDLDRESPGSIFAGYGDDPRPPDGMAPRPEVKLPPESWWARGLRIAVVAFFAFWVVACVVIFIMR
jgi:hypothetical protein